MNRISLPTIGGALALLVGLLLLTGCSEEIAKPVQTDTIAGAPEIPRNLQTAVGDAQVILTWTVNDPAKIARYLIYRGDTASLTPQIIDSTTQRTYTDNGLRNGARYVYAISAVNSSGLESRPSAPVTATPNLFGVTVNNGDRFTNNATVVVSFAAPISTKLVMLGNDQQFTGAQWSNFTATRQWQLPSGDGIKTIYARFLDAENNEVLGVVSDDITLDTRAFISAVTENSGGAVLSSGDEVVLTLDAGETDGTATVAIQNVATVELFDLNPESGDATADGVYHAVFVVPAGVDVIDATVTGEFTDAAGNAAAARVATTLITIANPPAAAILSAAAASEEEIELTWTRSSASDFQNYQLYRSETSTVDRNSKLIRTETNVATTSFRDSNLEPGKAYHYTIYTSDRSGLSTKGNNVTATTVANENPDGVSLFKSDEDTTSITLGWTPNVDEDFASYRIYRSVNSPVSTTSAANLVGVVTNAAVLAFTDTNISAGEQFYYAVVVYDKYGARSVTSNEVRGPNP